MGKKLIDGLITIEKLNEWFISLTTNQKLMVVLRIPLNSKVIDIEIEFFRIYDLKYTIDEIIEFYGEFKFWIKREYGMDKLLGYLVYTELNLKYNKYSELYGIIDRNNIFYFLSHDQMIEYLKVTTVFKWRTTQLIERYNSLSVDERNILNESFTL